MNTEMDYLIVGSFVVERLTQPQRDAQTYWHQARDCNPLDSIF
jgi:hypothetical protein